MPRWKKYTLIICGTLLGLMLLSMLIVPWQVKKQGRDWIAAHTSRTLKIEKAFFNPFTLTLELNGLTLSEQENKGDFVTFKRLIVSASAQSLIDFALILDRVELDDFYVNLELFDQQRFNFSDFSRLGEQNSEPAVTEKNEPLLFSVNNIVLTDGNIDFTAHVSGRESHHEIRDLQLSVPFIGNIPYLTDRYVEPHLYLLLNGAEVRANGQLKPFHQSLETRLSFTFDEVNLPYYASQSPVELPVQIRSGTLDTQIDLSYRVSANADPQLLLDGELALTDIDIREPDDAPLFRLGTLILELDRADLIKQDFNLSLIDIYNPQLSVDRDSSGAWNFQQLFARQHPQAEPPPPKETSQETLPLFKVAQLRLYDGKVAYRDASLPGGFSETLEGINLQVEQLSSHPNDNAKLACNLQTGRQATLAINGQLGLQPLSTELSVVLNGLPLEPHYPFLAGLLTQPLQGTLNVASQLQYDPQNQLRLSRTQLALHQLVVPFNDKDRLQFKQVSLTGGSFDLLRQNVAIGSLKLSDGSLTATRRADGSLSPLDLLRPQPAIPPAAKPAAEPADKDWQLSLNQFAIADFDLHFTDAALPKTPQLQIDDLALSVEKLHYPKSAQSPFTLSARIGKKGQLEFSGQLAHTPLRLQAQTRIKALPLSDFNDFVPEDIKFNVKDGNLDSSLTVQLLEKPDRLNGSFAGTLNINNFSLRDPLSQGELLAWEGLNLSGIKGEIAPFALSIKAVSLSNYLAKIQIEPDGRINLTSVAAQATPEGATQAEAEQPVATNDRQSGPPPDIRIDDVTLQGGTVTFTDRHLPSIFTTTMYQLGGRVSGLSSKATMLADVDLRGQLENHSPLTVTGKLNPLSKDLFADLTIRFKDIDLAPMSPYSGTYLGYIIDKGKLYLDLSYHIEHQKINAANNIMIDQFTFGDSVKSDQATSLPVALAIALLKDSNDEIHLDVPIRGDLSDPDFSVVGTVFTILKNLLVKAATAPFSLLASMFDGKEDFSSLTFASGIARLTAEQQGTLAKLADILTKRPALNLEISAFVDPAHDPEGYRQEQLRQQLIEHKWQKLQDEGKAPATRDQVSISEAEYPELLTAVYEKADFPRPRNLVGLLKRLPVPEMEKLLLSHIVVDEQQLQQLAQARARNVRDTLIADEESIKPRIFLKNVDIYQPPKEGPASRVEFSISSK